MKSGNMYKEARWLQRCLTILDVNVGRGSWKDSGSLVIGSKGMNELPRLKEGPTSLIS